MEPQEEQHQRCRVCVCVVGSGGVGSGSGGAAAVSGGCGCGCGGGGGCGCGAGGGIGIGVGGGCGCGAGAGGGVGVGGGGIGGGGGAAVAAGGGAGSGGIGGNRNWKKSKQKIPQRGLGVARLEKIRLEEQQQNAVLSSHSSSSLVMPVPPFPSTLFPMASDPNSIFKSSIPISSTTLPEFFTPVLPRDGSMTMSRGISTDDGFFPMWNSFEISPHDVAAANKKFAFSTPPKNSLNPIWQSPSPLPRRQQQQQQQHQQFSTSLVNASLSPPSSGVNLQMEPPSNQININNFNMPWPEEERNVVKMVGKKRPWLFPFDNMPGHTSFPSKLPLLPSSFSKPDESSSMYEHDMFKFEPRGTNFREGPSRSSTFQVDWGRSSDDPRPEKKLKENDVPIEYDFLTLGPSHAPSISVAPPLCKCKQPMVASPPHYHEHSGFSSVPYHGSMADPIMQIGVSTRSSAQLPFYNFMPMGPSSQETASHEQGGEAAENVDLDLKL